MSFSFKIESAPTQEIILLGGIIDGDANFSKITPKKSSQLIIDLKDVELLNSLGLRNWVQWVKTLDQYPSGIYLRNCPNVVVHQMNVLNGFMPLQAIVESIVIPFLCESCNTESNYLAVRGRDYKEAMDGEPAHILMAFSKKCENCGENAEADIIPSKYFQFLSRRH